MSLDWSVSDVKNWKEVTRNGEQLNPDTHFILFATMAVDIGHITEKNYKDFYLRCKFVYGLFYPEKMKGIPSIEVIKAHIGLRTNVTNKTFAYFKKRHVENFVHENMYQLRDK